MQPQSHQILAGAHAEQPAKLSLQLACRKSCPTGHVRDTDTFPIVSDGMLKCRGEPLVIVRCVSRLVNRPEDAGKANDFAARVKERNFRSQVPPGHASVVWHKPGLIMSGLIHLHDPAVIGNVFSRQSRRMKIKVSLADHLGGVSAAMEAKKTAIDPAETTLPIFAKKGCVGEGVKERQRLGTVKCRLPGVNFLGSRGGAGRSSHDAAILQKSLGFRPHNGGANGLSP